MIEMTRRAVVSAGLVVIAALVIGPSAFAGDYHNSAGLHCSDCHVMHASKDGTLYNGGSGFVGLLKGGTANDLCLSCHDGTDATAPDVVATGTAASPNDTLGIAYASKFKAGAGCFQSDCKTVATNYGHNLGGGAVIATQGTWASGGTGMKCTNCHDPHGGTNYRNIVVRPGTAGADVQVRGGVTTPQEVFLREAITVPATAVASATHYDTDAVKFNDPNNVVAWCVGCHTNINTGAKHPQDQAVSGADGAHWVTGAGTGFGVDVGDALAGIPRVRFSQVGTTYATSGTVATSNKEFCLSCHKAHGSKYDSTLVWPHYTSGAADQTSACGQCHNSGG